MPLPEAELHWSRTPQAAAAAEKEEEAALWASQCAPGRSDWGLFSCQRADATGDVASAGVTAQGGTDKAQVFTYAMEPPKAGCEHSIAVVKPIAGAGTTLMHGNFARRVSPSLEALSWRVAMRRKVFKGKRVLELGAGLGLTGLAVGAWTEASYVGHLSRSSRTLFLAGLAHFRSLWVTLAHSFLSQRVRSTSLAHSFAHLGSLFGSGGAHRRGSGGGQHACMVYRSQRGEVRRDHSYSQAAALGYVWRAGERGGAV